MTKSMEIVTVMGTEAMELIDSVIDTVDETSKDVLNKVYDIIFEMQTFAQEADAAEEVKEEVVETINEETETSDILEYAIEAVKDGVKFVDDNDEVYIKLFNNAESKLQKSIEKSANWSDEKKAAMLTKVLNSTIVKALGTKYSQVAVNTIINCGYSMIEFSEGALSDDEFEYLSDTFMTRKDSGKEANSIVEVVTPGFKMTYTDDCGDSYETIIPAVCVLAA